MNRAELIETWLHEERQPFIGWDFSYLDGRMTEGQVPWSYLDRAADLNAAVFVRDRSGNRRR